MNLADVLAITGGVCLLVGGGLGMLTITVNSTWREVADDGQRGAFFGAWFGVLAALVIYLAVEAN